LFPFPSNYSQFTLKFYVPKLILHNDVFDYNQVRLTLTRFDIGFIVGSVLSWVSIFALICGVIIAPFMEKSLILLQIKALFNL
jgi:hypothetical protein